MKKELIEEAITCLQSCIDDDYDFITMVSADKETAISWRDDIARRQGRIDGYRKSIELLEYILSQEK